MNGTQNTDTKTAIAYLRVSTKEQAAKGGQAEGFSIPAQREALHRKAQSLSSLIIAEFVDAGESAKSADRPDLQRMLGYLLENHVDYVLVHKVDRLARNRVDDVAITMAIKKSGATLVSATENIDETPSGMLLHGIMSTIAEFYSHNLAAEVHKGMSQKVKTGGTLSRAPLGYRNVGRLTSEGREERTVELDPERGELVAWAFVAFATGDWTLRSLADELEIRGLTTRRTPKQPARPLRPNVLHSMLTNPYYKGDVVYRGVVHKGNHQPLIDALTWQKVQDVLAVHAVGEKRREHPHYLKSSVFCGDCGSRLIITNARNRHGVIYPYFVCLGRQQKRTSCTRKAMLISKVEHLVEEYWAKTKLDPIARDTLEEGLRIGLTAQRQEASVERKHLLAAKSTLSAKRQKLVEAIYSGAMPMDLIAEQQEHLTSQLAQVERRLEAAADQFDRVDARLTQVLDLMCEGHIDYLAAEPLLRRLLNQALFTHLYIDDHGARANYAAPFDILFDPSTLTASCLVSKKSDKPNTGLTAMADVLGWLAPGANEKTPRVLCTAGGFPNNVPDPVVGVEGLKGTTMAALSDSLSNPKNERSLTRSFINISTMAALRDSLLNISSPLERVLEIRASQPRTGKRKKFNTAKLTIAQTGALDPATVRLQVKENRKLSAAAVERLVCANKTGTSQAKLAQQFGVHVETVNRHIRRRRQASKLGCAAVRYHTMPKGYAA